MLLAILFVLVVFGTAAGVVRCHGVQSAKYYYSQLDADEYATYLEGEGVGRWYGRGAERLGVRSGDVVRPDDLERLFRGFGPNREPLVQNAGGEKRRSGLELNFSLPKDYSILYALGDDETRAKIKQIFLRIVREHLDYIQEQFAAARRGHDGKTVEPCHLTFAIYIHHTCREGTPLLHAHVVVVNAAARLDGTIGAVDFRPLYKAQRLLSVMLDVRAASGLRQDLNMSVSRNGWTFRIRSIPAELIRLWTPRSRQIARALAGSSEHSPKAKAKAARATRGKRQKFRLDERLTAWAEQAGALAVPVRELLSRCKERAFKPPTPEVETRRATEAVRAAAEGMLLAKPAFTKTELEIATLLRALDDGLGVEAVMAAVNNAITRPIDHHLLTAGVSKDGLPLYQYWDPPGPRPVTSIPLLTSARATGSTLVGSTRVESPRVTVRAAVAGPSDTVIPTVKPAAASSRTHHSSGRPAAPRNEASAEKPGPLQAFRDWFLVRRAAHELVTTVGSFSRETLHREVSRQLAAKNVRPRAHLEYAVGRFVAQPKRNGLVPVGDRSGDQAWTTRRHAKLERRLVQEAKRLLASQGRKVRGREVESGKERVKARGEATVQSFSEIAKDRARLQVLDAAPGERRTRVLISLARAYERSGFDVRWAAPTGAAAEEAARNFGVQAVTTGSLIARAGKTPVARLIGPFFRPTFRSFAAKIKGLAALRRPVEPLTRKSVVIVTDAQALGTKEAHALFKLARKAGTKVVLAGDTFHAPGAGSASGLFRFLVDRGVGHSLPSDEITSRPESKAAQSLRRDCPGAAVETLIKAGQLYAGGSPTDAAVALRERFREAGGLIDPRRHLIVTGKAEEAVEFNGWVQRERKQGGELGIAAVRVPRGPKLYSGDRVSFTRSDRSLGVRAGEAGTVVSVNPFRKTVTVAKDSGHRVTVAVGRYRHIALGYAATFARAASVRAAHSYLLLRGYSPAPEDRDQREWVVSRQVLTAVLERAAERSELFADRAPDNLAECLTRQGYKTLATEHALGVSPWALRDHDRPHHHGQEYQV